jgi:hypothetical protein
MIKDERIIGVNNRIAARGFGIWYVLSLVALLYRQFYLGQPAKEYWDMALIFFVGTSYVTIASFAQGAVHETAIRRYGKRTVPAILLTIVAVMYFRGQINSPVDLVVAAISALASLSLLGLLFHYLYRRWERQTGLNS